MTDYGFPFQRLDAYKVARDVARLVHVADVKDNELRDQATRAAKSAFLNLCEGLPNDRLTLRRKYFTDARKSLCETVGAIDLAQAIGAITEADAVGIFENASRLRAMLTALLR